ncbi:hypothetical protein PWT90_03599 [Aphanocladium album]|nr:hypothetical protein PWT90_03599 [Aphanocladium album]
MADYQAVPANEFFTVLKSTPIKRKPVSSIYQPPLATNAPQDNAKDSQVLIAPSSTDANSKGSSISPSHPSKHRERRGIWRLWKWELLSLVTSASLLIVIIITLREFEDKDLSDWQAPVSINAVISVLSALFKGSLSLPVAEGISQLKWLWFSDRTHRLADLEKFDRASRSTWGAVLFLARQLGRERLSTLATFGAFLSLVTLAVDPFSQASVSVATCQRVVSAPAKIPRANVYSANGGHYGADMNALDAPMQLAFTLGATQPPANSSRSVAADVVCPTTNCTFPATTGDGGGASFMTLAMCQSCRDVSASIVKTQNGTHIAWSLPPLPDLEHEPLELWAPGTDTLFSMNASPDTFGRQGGPWAGTGMVGFQGLVERSTNTSCEDYWKCDRVPFAFDCSLRPCVKTFAANMSSGVYSEAELSRQYLHATPQSKGGPIPDLRPDFQLDVDRRIVNGTWVDCKGATNRSSLHSVEVPRSDGASGPAILWYERECVYSVRHGAVSAMSMYFEDMISKGSVQNHVKTAFEGDTWLKMLFNGGNINLTTVSRFADGVTDSVSAQMRRAAEPANATENPANAADGLADVVKIPNDVWTFAYGHGYESRPCIRVRWKWLSFLGIVFLAEVCFLIMLIFTNRQSRWSGDWKSSSLALLLQPWDRDYMPVEEADDDRARLYKVADGTQTRLSQVDGKWRLIRADEA